MRIDRLFFVIIFGFSMLLAGPVIGASRVDANPKAAELQQKIADINLLLQQIKDRSAHVQSIRNALGEQHDALASEIQIIRKSLGIRSIKQAQRHLRLHYNLDLLCTILTYMDELDAKLLLLQTGRDRLNYLRQLAEDDIRMITTLNDLKIEALTTQISLVINRYLPEAHTIQIDPQHLPLLTVQQVWDRLTKGS